MKKGKVYNNDRKNKERKGKFLGIKEFINKTEEKINEIKKEPKPFLRRRSQRIKMYKVNWKNVTRQIDCWNPSTRISRGKSKRSLSPPLKTLVANSSNTKIQRKSYNF